MSNRPAIKRHRSLKTLFTSGCTEIAIVHHGWLNPVVSLLKSPIGATS